MNKLIKWINDGDSIWIRIREGDVFQLQANLIVDALVMEGDVINIGAGDLDIWIKESEIRELPEDNIIQVGMFEMGV
ncbi:hypothetical protein SAMN05660484_02226 [Eubacterium ruminantium]|uniref:Uncharacterized protein n=1 Tax=Eubacterium ruminantium TaxID=42322 RepID=A0A1T4Q4E2_9FIRM|nr:hypothetical protein [Eubacterium ruminantium]SCW64162.1 hypothetical protein SAMN05660484_02226 [Eubacterium ruminantium]SDN30802.1 hypothetical protein SAMN04490370_11644 [Eubacterium ruminantium]SJZ98665.1 hypothetical protein SAMN02745110_02257 [Eubacterium ruminantium]